VTNIAPVGYASQGAGYWGQLDLAGEMWEWNLDWGVQYVDPCTDCAYLTPGSYRVLQGGGFSNGASDLLSSFDLPYLPNYRAANYGFRCARTP
jgi:formylglycine-generating enzyme